MYSLEKENISIEGKQELFKKIYGVILLILYKYLENTNLEAAERI